MISDYELVIGLEIHAELNTNTKIFCGCKKSFGDIPNSNCCPVCLGFPGALPILNKKAVEYTIKAGIAADCKINDYAIFERKNYFYPDLSKAYQISQLEKPICVGGKLQLDSGKIIRLNRIHLEEDAGKLIHTVSGTNIDYNRGGIPLIESVTEPDISSADEAIEFLVKLRDRFVFAGVAECKMEQGGMRCDVNLSVRKKGADKLGTRTEMKNLNSFKSVARSIEFEFKRQVKLIENGGQVVQETRKWDDEKGESYSMRTKEDSNDYRYFPDPDILTVRIDKNLVEKIKKSMPLLPNQKKDKYINEYNLPERDVNILIANKEASDFFDECVSILNEPKEISNWIITDVLKVASAENPIKITSGNLIEIIKLVLSKKISRVNAKDLFYKIYDTNENPVELAEKMGMFGKVDDSELENMLNALIKENPKAAADYAENKDKVTNFFVGRIMGLTKGKANVDMLKTLIEQKLN